MRAVHPYCAYSVALYLTFFTLNIFPACPNITSWCSQAPKLPCRVKAHGNVGNGERLTARHLPEHTAERNSEGTLSAEVAVRNLRLVPCWREWEDLVASWGDKILKGTTRRKILSLKE